MLLCSRLLSNFSIPTTPNNERHWRGKNVPYSIDGITRMILGCGFFLLTVISVVLGPSYPFWIVPCFVILFTWLTGLPGGSGVQQVLLTRTSTKDGTNELSLYRATMLDLFVYSYPLFLIQMASHAMPITRATGTQGLSMTLVFSLHVEAPQELFQSVE